jgi:hypothetical protein
LLFEKIESENPSPEHSPSFPGNQENSSLARTGLLFRCAAKLNADIHSEFPRALRALDDPANYRPDHACDDEFNPRRCQFRDFE